MSSTLKVIVAVMISSTFGFMASYVFTNKKLTQQLATALTNSAAVKDALAKTRLELSGVRDALTEQSKIQTEQPKPAQLPKASEVVKTAQWKPEPVIPTPGFRGIPWGSSRQYVRDHETADSVGKHDEILAY